MRRAIEYRWPITKNRCSLCTSWLLRPRVCTPNIFRRSAIPSGPICLPWPHLCVRAGSSSPKPLVLVSRWTSPLYSAIAWIGDLSPPPVRLPSRSTGEGSYCRPGSTGTTDHQMRATVLESQCAQTQAGNVLVFLGGQATHADPSHDRARLGMQYDEPALYRRQIRISHLGDRTALALQAISVCERVLTRQRRGVRLAHGHPLG